jgi:hypothetical protein
MGLNLEIVTKNGNLIAFLENFYSALPIGAYGGLGRSGQGMMSPMSGYGSCEHHVTVV